MIAIKAHFDGKNIVPDEPLELPKDQPLNVTIDVGEAKPKKRKLGTMRGTIWMSPDFVDPLPDEFWEHNK